MTYKVLRKSKGFIACLCFVIVAFASTAHAAGDLLTKKMEFKLDEFQTVGKETIKNVKIGYETYGTLNADKSNVILICHFFSGNSHAAGKYSAEDSKAGYWDNVIGSGKPIDTDKYFVISSDTLVNLGVHNPKVITTGPASINPDTGKAYGLDFPVVTMEDFVNVQKELLDSMGIKKLHAVAGASMGSIQAITWAAKYPDMVERVMPVISPGAVGTPYLISMLKRWADVIKLDPNWNGGDYYGKERPLDGLNLALQSVTIDAFQRGWVAKHDNKWADEKTDPAFDMQARYSVEKMLDDRGEARAKGSDANHFLYLVKANQSYDVRKDVKNMKAKFLFLPAEGDLIFPPSEAQAFADQLKAQGNEVDLQVLTGPLGHINGVVFVPQATEKILKWLE